MIGTIARYLVTQVMFKNTGAFPTSTFLVNITGCLIIGLLWGIQSRTAWLTKDLEMFLILGLCGGYTTFSAFSIENVRLLQQGQMVTAFAYTLASVICGITLTFLGYWIVRNA